MTKFRSSSHLDSTKKRELSNFLPQRKLDAPTCFIIGSSFPSQQKLLNLLFGSSFYKDLVIPVQNLCDEDKSQCGKKKIIWTQWNSRFDLRDYDMLVIFLKHKENPSPLAQFLLQKFVGLMQIVCIVTKGCGDHLDISSVLELNDIQSIEFAIWRSCMKRGAPQLVKKAIQSAYEWCIIKYVFQLFLIFLLHSNLFFDRSRN